MMAAALLQQETVIFHRCPRIADVWCMEEILKSVGVRTEWCGESLLIDCSNIYSGKIPGAYADKMRSSVFLLGSFLPRYGKISISYPGGCTIGKRPIDLHLDVLRALGVEFYEANGGLYACAKKLSGCRYRFSKVSVGATENAVMAAAVACGETYLLNCAREPEVVHLCRFLRAMGARIWGEGTGEIRVLGVNKLYPTEFSVPSDRIVAGTYLLAGAATRGKIALEQVPLEEMDAIMCAYQKIGGQYEVKGGTLIADSRYIERPIPFLETAGYPGFPTDLQSPLTAVCATIEGRSKIRETIFEDRFRAAVQMKKMGADVRRCNDMLEIIGGSLQGARVCAEDLRGGAALVVAGLAARGQTEIEGLTYIDRGYEHMERDITLLGGRIRRIQRK
ncbi:MAG: UDP-N-acetylglucosamine 1-carboxyvinyltransferase [Clostridiales bacterium]|nr:UDP-N-acetylglucosamine 1-carboxyvinyltransferase [Clostridiales bacterium]